ncbi:hypothetical protein BGW80DRAFT_1287492 [Lactifluus volemus]|nr:hypothetical protein BGW80DRAFT_1287492 [Lactifluus volemus]
MADSLRVLRTFACLLAAADLANFCFFFCPYPPSSLDSDRNHSRTFWDHPTLSGRVPGPLYTTPAQTIVSSSPGWRQSNDLTMVGFGFRLVSKVAVLVFVFLLYILDVVDGEGLQSFVQLETEPTHLRRYRIG